MPQYPVPKKAIEKPGMLGKMMSKMLKPPKMKSPKLKIKSTVKVKKKQAHFY